MSPVDLRELGEFVRRHRKAKHLTMRALADMAGIGHTSVHKIEHGDYGQPAPEKLRRLASGLGVPAEDLYALAGYVIPDRLPDFAPYLRAKFDLPEEAVNQLQQYFQLLLEKYGGGGGKGHGGRSE